MEQISKHFANESAELKKAVDVYLAKYFPKETLAIFVSDSDTSALEAFHGHLHQLVGKARHLLLYRPRIYLHVLIWNPARIKTMLRKRPGAYALPDGLLLGEDWLRRLQTVLGLVVLGPESKKARRKEAKKIEKAQGKKKVLPTGSVIPSLLTETRNTWN